MKILFDTSALLNDALNEIKYQAMILSPTVLRELEYIKFSSTKDEDIKAKARKVCQALRNNNHTIIATTNKQKESIRKQYDGILSSNYDSEIIVDAIAASRLYRDAVVLYTSDVLMWHIVRVLDKETNLSVEFFTPTQEVHKALWSGWIETSVSSTIIVPDCYNEYIKFYNDDGTFKEAARVDKEIGLARVEYQDIKSEYMGIIKPRNVEQELAFDLLQNDDIRIKVLLGGFGTGKTLLALAHALYFVHTQQVEKIVFIRNNIEVKDVVPLGALPGDDIEKIYPFLMNIADHCGGVEGLETLLDMGMLEPVHLGYIRGRDIKKSIIICDEAENLTTQQVQLLIGRVAEGSQLWFIGDLKQTDKKVFEENSGLRSLINALKGNELFGVVRLVKSERSKVSALADLLD